MVDSDIRKRTCEYAQTQVNTVSYKIREDAFRTNSINVLVGYSVHDVKAFFMMSWKKEKHVERLCHYCSQPFMQTSSKYTTEDRTMPRKPEWIFTVPSGMVLSLLFVGAVFHGLWQQTSAPMHLEACNAVLSPSDLNFCGSGTKNDVCRKVEIANITE